jgi:hypothetical protein
MSTFLRITFHVNDYDNLQRGGLHIRIDIDIDASVTGIDG